MKCTPAQFSSDARKWVDGHYRTRLDIHRAPAMWFMRNVYSNFQQTGGGLPRCRPFSFLGHMTGASANVDWASLARAMTADGPTQGETVRLTQGPLPHVPHEAACRAAHGALPRRAYTVHLPRGALLSPWAMCAYRQPATAASAAR